MRFVVSAGRLARRPAALVALLLLAVAAYRFLATDHVAAGGGDDACAAVHDLDPPACDGPAEFARAVEALGTELKIEQISIDGALFGVTERCRVGALYACADRLVEGQGSELSRAFAGLARL